MPRFPFVYGILCALLITILFFLFFFFFFGGHVLLFPLSLTTPFFFVFSYVMDILVWSCMIALLVVVKSSETCLYIFNIVQTQEEEGEKREKGREEE